MLNLNKKEKKETLDREVIIQEGHYIEKRLYREKITWGEDIYRKNTRKRDYTERKSHKEIIT